jgi:hypothetical protein
MEQNINKEIKLMNYNKERTEQDLYNCAVWHYEIEKINKKEASPHLEDG